MLFEICFAGIAILMLSITLWNGMTVVIRH
jgi:hypothetical protein